MGLEDLEKELDRTANCQQLSRSIREKPGVTYRMIVLRCPLDRHGCYGNYDLLLDGDIRGVR
jgi:hypothetical protein